MEISIEITNRLPVRYRKEIHEFIQAFWSGAVMLWFLRRILSRQMITEQQMLEITPARPPF